MDILCSYTEVEVLSMTSRSCMVCLHFLAEHLAGHNPSFCAQPHQPIFIFLNKSFFIQPNVICVCCFFSLEILPPALIPKFFHSSVRHHFFIDLPQPLQVGCCILFSTHMSVDMLCNGPMFVSFQNSCSEIPTSSAIV